jgi:pilus assembly protein CpaB
MQTSRIILFTGAIGFALCSALVVRAWVQTVRAEAAVPTPVAVAPPPMPVTKVLVAAAELPAGRILRAEDLKWQGWPDADVSASYVVEGHGDRDKFVGAVVRQGLQAGVPVTDQRVVFRGEHGVLAAMLRPGYRAVTVSITGNVGLSGLVIPGDRVDVIVGMAVNRPGEKGQRKLSQTVMRDVRVIAVDQNIADMKSESGTAHTATLEVTSKQAEMLVLVGDMGKVSLSLRSMGDDKTVDPAQSITWDSDASSALARVEKSPTAVPQEKIGIVRGTKPSEVEFERSAR